MLLCNKAETGWAAPSDVQKAGLCLSPIAPCKAYGKTTLTKCSNSNSSHRLSSKPLSSSANSGTWCSTLQVAIMWQVSGTAGRGRRTATYLGGSAAAGKYTWQYEKVWENLIKLSDEITPDSLRGISVTNKTGQSYYALLWVTHSCYVLYANSDVCWTALWADSLHLPGKNTHSKSQLKRPNKHWGPQSHYPRYPARSMRKTLLPKYYSAFMRDSMTFKWTR